MSTRKLLALLAILVVAFGLTPLIAQQEGGTQTAQQAKHFDAAVTCASLDAASGSATLTPTSGFSYYITLIEANVGGTATVSAVAPIKATSAGLSGSPTFGLFRADAMTVGQVGAPLVLTFPNGLKGQANTAVSVTGGAVANLAWHITICGYQAP